MLPVSTYDQQQEQTTQNYAKNDPQTPPIRPKPPTDGIPKAKKTISSSTSTSSVHPSGARRKISPMPISTSASEDQDDEEYNRFVQSLGQDDAVMTSAALQSLLMEDDEEDFVLTDLEDDDDEDDDDLLGDLAAPSSPGADNTTTNKSLPASPLLFDHPDFYSELEAELGSLLEEDLEAAVSSLLASNNHHHKTKKGIAPKTPTNAAAVSMPLPASPSTPLKESAKHPHVVTPQQVQRLQILMQSHYQLLVQSAVLSVRAARKEYPEESALCFHGGETAEDLLEILDGAVGMLQDLDQNRKDAIRNYIQRCETTPQAQRSLLPQFKGSKRLTRSAFHSLQESTNAQTIFDVDGLYSLKQTFRTIDHVGATQEGMDILEPVQHFDACRLLLEQAGAKVIEKLLPGKIDLSQVVADPKELFGKDFKPPMTIAQQIQLRKNRNQFTAAEDNLILRGVNLYGEKQWMLIADRFLPDRSVNIISQRYSKICLLLYKAHGVHIDENGNLLTPPRFEKVDQLDEAAISKIKPASPPAILNVHRWSLEEDVTLLKAVPLLGNQWAELSTRLMPHRDRGHLRKRYQVLERRVKATVTRSKRGDVPPMLPRTTPAAAVKATAKAESSKPRKRRVGQEPNRPSASIIRGPMPAHLLCPANANGPKHPVAKFGRKTMDFTARRTQPKRPLPLHGTDGTNGGYPPAGPAHPGAPHYGGSHPDEYPNGGYVPTNHESSHDASRFENILSEATDDWSQLSRMKRMMDNETESMVADAIVNKLGKLPEMEVEASTGLSMLQNGDNSRDADANVQGPATPSRPQNGSLMASVLEHARKEDPNESSPGQDNVQKLGAPAGVPSTPSGQTQKYYPLTSYGTPLGVSPGPGLMMRTFYSPGGHKNGQSPGLKHFSPGPLHSPEGGVHSLMMGGVPTNDYELYPLEFTDASRQALEDSAGASQPAGTSNPGSPSNAADMFHGSHDLKATDLDAISALNSLSNSPAKYFQKRPSTDVIQDEKAKSDTTKQSLFDAVVRGVEQKESKRKKQRTK